MAGKGGVLLSGGRGYDPAKLAAIFDEDTSVSKMLQQLYGKPKYRMPELALKTRPMNGAQPTMVGLHARPGASDPRHTTVNRSAIAESEANKPPAVTVREVHVAPIEAKKGRIRTQGAIAQRLAAEEAGADIACVPIRPGRNTEMEKRKLELTFALKGGLALPEAALSEALPGPLPMHLVTGKPGPGGRARAGGHPDARRGAPPPPSSQLYDELKKTYGELTTALDEARTYWDELKALQGGRLKAEQAREACAEEDGRTAALRRLVEEMRAERARVEGAGAHHA